MIGTALLALLAGCEPVPSSGLDDVSFPPGSHYDAQRDVQLDVTPVGSVDGLHLTVLDPSGVLLFDGAVRHAVEWGVHLRQPPDVTSLQVVVRDADGADHAETVALDAEGHAAVEVGR